MIELDRMLRNVFVMLRWRGSRNQRVLDVKKSLRHTLQMPVHHISHVIRDMLCDPVVYITFKHADQARKKRYTKRCNYVYDKKSHILSYETFIDDLTGKYRR